MHVAPGSEPPSRSELCFVIGRQRSGTTVFRRMLGTHPQVVDMGEIFNEDHPRSYWRFLKEQLLQDNNAFYQSKSVSYFLKYLDNFKLEIEQQRHPRAIIVMDIKYDQANSIRGAWQDMNTLPRMFYMIRQYGWKVIDIHRNNLLNLVVSNFVAMETKLYHSNLLEDRQRQTPKVRINTIKLLQEMESTRLSYERLVRHFTGYLGYMKLVYEEMFAGDDPGLFSSAVVEQVCSFLQVDNLFDPRAKLQKLLSSDVFSHIENATEVREALSRGYRVLTA